MLRIIVPEAEFFDESTSKFVTFPEVSVELEHSLYSISLWESKWKKPFLETNELNNEELASYIRCMSKKELDDDVISRMSRLNFENIGDYIGDSMTATTFPESHSSGSRERITSELIYYWMVAGSVPFECQYWHLNRLLALIRVINHKNNPPKKMSRSEMAARNRQLNEQRRAQMGTRG